MSERTKGATILLGVYAAAGVVTGLLFSKAMYHQGRISAFKEVTHTLEELRSEMLEKSGEES